MAINDANEIRREIARHVVERKHQQLGEHMQAGACYGSVAHNAASEYSDVELVILTDDTLSLIDESFFEQGIMVECTTLPTTRMFNASQRVTGRWGIEADQYRHHLPIWDPNNFFPKLWDVARNLPQESFVQGLRENWWSYYERRTKFLNAFLLQDMARIQYDGWGVAFGAAMHIALHEQRPYESMRTIWKDVSERGYGMTEMVDLLVTGPYDQLPDAVEVVWKNTHSWGVPEGAVNNGN